jgi:hypothetical protein
MSVFSRARTPHFSLVHPQLVPALHLQVNYHSSASSALFDSKPREDASNNAFPRSISTLETKIVSEDPDDLIDEGRVVLQGRGREIRNENLQQQK